MAQANGAEYSRILWGSKSKIPIVRINEAPYLFGINWVQYGDMGKQSPEMIDKRQIS